LPPAMPISNVDRRHVRGCGHCAGQDRAACSIATLLLSGFRAAEIGGFERRIVRRGLSCILRARCVRIRAHSPCQQL
jgi:hypothetical protein